MSAEGLRNADGKLCLLRWSGVLWTRADASRKLADCQHCKRPIPKGAAIYRPLGNGSTRMHRLHAECAEALANG